MEINRRKTRVWKKTILPILQVFTDRTPGSSIEEKTYSLVWHYRLAARELAMIRIQELKDAISRLIANMDLGVYEGNKIVEIKIPPCTKDRRQGNGLKGRIGILSWPQETIIPMRTCLTFLPRLQLKSEAVFPQPDLARTPLDNLEC